MINMKNFLTNATRNRDTPLRFLNPSTDEMSSVPLGVIAIPHVLIIERDFFVVEFVNSAAGSLNMISTPDFSTAGPNFGDVWRDFEVIGHNFHAIRHDFQETWCDDEIVRL